MTLNKKNDVNWCMQFVGLFLGICFLIVGAFSSEELLNSFLDHSQIYFGIIWLFLALIHRIKWLHKVELHEARKARQPTESAEGETQNKMEKPTPHRS